MQVAAHVESCCTLALCIIYDVQVLLSKGVEESKILFLSLIAAPEGIHRICAAFPRVKVITSEIDEGIGPDFQVVPGTKAVQILCSAACLYPGPSGQHCHAGSTQV